MSQSSKPILNALTAPIDREHLAPNMPVSVVVGLSASAVTTFFDTGGAESTNEVMLLTSENLAFESLTHNFYDKTDNTITIKLSNFDLQVVRSFFGAESVVVSYGIGRPNKFYWAGPYYFEIIDIDYSVSPGGREMVEITAVPNALSHGERKVTERNKKVKEKSG